MASKVLKDNKTAVPFRNKRISIVRGLDPLGLQNSSVRTYALLMPGLNNVTGKLRYYSFYSWLLQQYFELNGTYSPESQLQFIRFGEYILALLANTGDDYIRKTPGSLYAGRLINETDEHLLIEHAFTKEGTTRGSYWTYKWGAFGQYYLGAMRDIGIVNSYESYSNLYAAVHSTEIHNVSGEILAESFDESITNNGTKGKEAFLEAIHISGKITKETLTELRKVFDFSKIEGKREQQELLKMLLQKDYPLMVNQTSSYRRETIFQLLRFLKQTNIVNPKERDFTYYAYESQGKIENQDNECMLGWYYYQLNECWQYSCTAMLNGLLLNLKQHHGSKAVPLNEYLNQLTNEVLIELGGIDEIQKMNIGEELTNQNTLSLMNELSLTLGVVELKDVIEKHQNVSRIAYSFLSIWKLYNENKNQLDQLISFFRLKKLGTFNQFTSLGFLQKLPIQAGKFTLRDFVFQFLHKHVIHRHQLVAYKKMPSTMSQTTLKFQLEDNQIRFLMEFNPAFTGPRINNLIEFLKDLEILNYQQQLSKKGEKLLSQLQAESNS